MDYHNRFSTLYGRIVSLALLLVTCAHHLNALDLTALASQFPIKPNTLSFAYMKDSTLGDHAEAQYDTTPAQDALIEQILQKEIELTNAGYLVLYHAHKDCLYVLYEFYKQLYCHINHCPEPLEFEFLRSPLQSISEQSAEHFLQQYGRYGICDNYDPHRSQLLSVNVSLFGNTWKWGESSLKLFLQNRNFFPPAISSSIVQDLSALKYINPDKQIVISNEIENLCTIAHGHASLIQIAIPQYIASDLCYLCTIRGEAIDYPGSSFEFDTKQYLNGLTQHLNSLAQEPYYRNKTHTIDHVQMRILMQPSKMGTHRSGIKMFRYTTLAPQDARTIKQALSTFF